MSVVTKQDYFDTAMDLLSRDGYSGLKLAPLCKALHVTTGSFYNYFTSWKDFTSKFLDNWRAERTTLLVELAKSHTDPVAQLRLLHTVSLALPHSAEAAIRVWSQIDEDVREVQEAVDRQRFAVVLDAMKSVFRDSDEAVRHAEWGIYILVGFEQFARTHDISALDWSLDNLLTTLEERQQQADA